VSGGYAVSKDGGQTWEEIAPLIAGERPVRTLAMDPDNPNNLFAGFDEFGLYRSSDAGRSWQKISAGLTPEANVTSVIFDPTDSSILYLADRGSGVYFSTDGGQRWQPLNDGLSHRTAIALGLSDDGTVLYASIEGAGAYRLGSPPPVQGADQLQPSSGSATGETGTGTGSSGGSSAGPSDQAGGSRGLFACPSSYLPLLMIGALLAYRRRIVPH
jgi:hypothetical protein